MTVSPVFVIVFVAALSGLTILLGLTAKRRWP